MALGPQDEPLEPRRDVERLARIAKEPKLAIDYVARSASPPAGTGELLRAAVIGVPVAANDYKEQARRKPHLSDLGCASATAGAAFGPRSE